MDPGVGFLVPYAYQTELRSTRRSVAVQERQYLVKPRLPIHSLLLAAFAVLTLYRENVGEMPVMDTVGPLAFVLGLTAALLVLFRLIIRDSEKTGIVLTAFILFSFFYTATFEAAQGVLKHLGIAWIVKNRTFFPLWVLLFLTTSVVVTRTRRELRTLNRTLTLGGTILLAMAVLRIGTFLVAHPDVARANKEAMTRDAIAEFGPPILLSQPDKPPDIYYLIFDRYPSSEVLREFYGYDNEPLLGLLRKKGFRIIDWAVANYPKTHLSLASSLNMSYLGPTYHGRLYYTPFVKRSLVVQMLKKAGYRYIHLGSWYEPTRKSPLADRNIKDPLMISEFGTALLATTPYHLFISSNDRYRQGLYILDHLEKVHAESGPKFVFAHVLLPHPPYVFDRDGSPLPDKRAISRTEKENFLNQLQFLNGRLLRIVDSLTADSSTPPIIILQADEGPFLDSTEGGMSTPEMWRKRAGILNAYHLPGGESDLYDSITPVNTFRLLFRHYFKAPIDLLDDRIYYWSSTKADGGMTDVYGSFPFIDITEGMNASMKGEQEPRAQSGDR
jgi:hypothetical protein